MAKQTSQGLEVPPSGQVQVPVFQSLPQSRQLGEGQTQVSLGRGGKGNERQAYDDGQAKNLSLVVSFPV